MSLAPTLGFYVGRHFLVALAATLLVICGLIMLFEVVELLRRTSTKQGVEFDLVLTMALLKTPRMINTVLPFAVLIATVFALWRLTRSQELIAIRAAGVSAAQFMRPAVLMAAAIGAINVAVLNPIAASMFAKFEKIEGDLVLRENALTLNQAGLWLREAGEGNAVIVHASAVRQDSDALGMNGVNLFLFEGDSVAGFIQAERGSIGDGRLVLEEAWTMTPGEASVFHERLERQTGLTLSRIQENFASPETISFWELPDFIRFFDSAGFATHKHRLYFQSLLASPLLLAAMVLVAASLALTHSARARAWLWRGLGVVFAGFAFYVGARVIYALGQSQSLPLLLAAWSPPAITALIGSTLLLHREDG